MRFGRERISHVPEALKIANVQPASQDLDRCALGAYHLATDDAFDEVEVDRPPLHQPLIPVEESLGELKRVLVRMAFPLQRREVKIPPREQLVERLAD